MSSSALVAVAKRPIVQGGGAGGMITKLLRLRPVILRGGITNTKLLLLRPRPGLPLSPSRSLRTSSSILSCVEKKQRTITPPFVPIRRIIGCTCRHTTASPPPSSSGNTDKHRDVKEIVSSSEILDQIARLEKSWKNKMETKMNDFEARMNKTSKRAEEGIKKWELYDYWNMRIACFFTVVYIFIFSWWGYRDWRDGKKRREDQQRFEEERQRREAEWKRL